MRVDVRLRTPEVATDDRLFAEVVRCLLEGVCWANVAFLREHPDFPALYDAGVVYDEEPPGTEEFVGLTDVAERGWGDCAHLAAWRVAELRCSGEDAGFVVMWNQDRMPGDHRIFHVLVRRGDDTEEDPSEALGMEPIE